jgi:hypothetical protein
VTSHATSQGYSVLATVSSGYPDLRGRFLTCYSPVRHSIMCGASTTDRVRLACMRHAASVRPEPGSNSPSKSGTSRRTRLHHHRLLTPNIPKDALVEAGDFGESGWTGVARPPDFLILFVPIDPGEPESIELKCLGQSSHPKKDGATARTGFSSSLPISRSVRLPGGSPLRGDRVELPATVLLSALMARTEPLWLPL